jgi:DNA-binding NarL/FixJ family response regulator
VLATFDDDTDFEAMRVGAWATWSMGRRGRDRPWTPRRHRQRGRPSASGSRSGARVLRGRTSGADPFPELTARERAVFDLMAAGERSQVIADQLFLSPKTVVQSALQSSCLDLVRPGAGPSGIG